MRGLLRLAMEGWGVGLWVVVKPRDDCFREGTSALSLLFCVFLCRLNFELTMIRALSAEGATRGLNWGIASYIRVLAAPAVAQELGVFRHQHGAGILGWGAAGANRGRGADGAREFGDGGGDAGHFCADGGE